LPLKEVRDRYVKGAEVPEAKALEERHPSAALADAMKDKALVGSIIKEWVKENV
jgi:hypothetical protein